MHITTVRRTILASFMMVAVGLSVRPPAVHGQDTYLKFDGFNQYVDIADSVNLDITGAITIEARIFTPGAVGGLWIASKVGVNSGYELMLNGNTLLFSLNQQVAASTDFTNFLNTWTVIKATWDGTTDAFGIRINIGGGDEGFGTHTGVATVANSELLVIGQRSNHSGSNGQYLLVDYVKIWSGATLVGDWQFNEGAGQVVASTTGRNAGQLGNSGIADFWDPTWVSQSSNTIVAPGAIVFPGTGITMDFATPSAGDVTVQQFSAPPVAVSGVTQPDVADASWVIESDITFGSGTEIRFKLADIPGDPIPFPTSAVVYKRDTPNTGTFAAVTTSWDSGTGEVVASGFTSFSEFIIAHGEILPVELTSFEVIVTGDEASLRWETLSELNNAGFEVHVSHEGSEFEIIGFIEGKGTTADYHEYRYVAHDLAPGRHAFRLKQIDFDGAFEFSATIETIVEVPGEYVLESAYPNPFNPSTTIRFGVARGQNVRAVLYNSIGQAVSILYDGHVDANEMQSLRINARDLPSGTYSVRVSGESFDAVEHITLVK